MVNNLLFVFSPLANYLCEHWWRILLFYYTYKSNLWICVHNYCRILVYRSTISRWGSWIWIGMFSCIFLDGRLSQNATNWNETFIFCQCVIWQSFVVLCFVLLHWIYYRFWKTMCMDVWRKLFFLKWKNIDHFNSYLLPHTIIFWGLVGMAKQYCFFHFVSSLFANNFLLLFQIIGRQNP